MRRGVACEQARLCVALPAMCCLPQRLIPSSIPPRSPSSVPHRLDFLQEFFKSVPKLQGRKFFVTGWARAGGQEGKRGLAAPVQLLASLARFGGLLCHSSCT